MRSILGPGAGPLSGDELALAREVAQRVLQIRVRRAVWAVVGFGASLAAIVPISTGHSFQQLGRRLGMWPVYLVGAMWCVCFSCLVSLFYAWRARRSLR